MKYEVIVAKEATEAACTVLWLEKFTSTYTSFQNLIVPALQQPWLQGSFKPSYESLEASFLPCFKLLQWESLCLSTDFISINLGFSLFFCGCAFGRGHVETVRFPALCTVFHLPFKKFSVVCIVQSTHMLCLGSQRERWKQLAQLFSITQVQHFQGFLANTESLVPEVIGDPCSPG